MKSPKRARFYKPQAKNKASAEPLRLQIDSLSHDGRGIARHRGKTVFVSNALPGEEVIARITESRGRFDQAISQEILTASPDRVEPQCRHYHQCGGCQLQHLAADQQIALKQQQALQQLIRIGKTEPEEIAPPLDATPWHYRRRARLSVYCPKAKSEPILGYRRQQSQELVPVKECPILDSRLEALLAPLNAWLQSCFNPQAMGHIELISTETQIALLLRHPRKLDETDQQNLLDLADAHQALLFLQGEDHSASIQCLNSDSRELEYSLAEFGLQLAFAPEDFTQINPAINQLMVQQAIDWLQPNADDRILDLFCGLGNFTLPLAQRAEHVTGLEGAATMVARAEANALSNNLGNARFAVADLNQPEFNMDEYTKVVLDPPRAGAQAAIEKLANGKTDILYVSCDPATLARDASILVQSGYRLRRWGVMNMFPHTSHVESMALFQR